MLYLPSTAQKYLVFYLFSVLLCCRLTAVNVPNCVSVSCPLGEAEKSHAFQLWSERDPAHWLWEVNCLWLQQLGSGLRWTHSEQRYPKTGWLVWLICHSAHSAVPRNAGKWKSALKSFLLFTYLHGLQVIWSSKLPVELQKYLRWTGLLVTRGNL